MKQMKIECKKCKGVGKVPDMIERIATLGISWIYNKVLKDTFGWDICPKCNGKGHIKF